MARKDADMTQGPIWRHLMAFALPMVLGMLFQQLYNTVDMVVVGQFVGKEAQAAVGSTGSIVNMLIGLFNGIAMGASVKISQAYGAHDEKRLHSVVHTTVTVSFIMCLIATLIGLSIVRPMLHAMQTPADVIDEATNYLTIYFIGITGLLMYNMGGGILRAVGDARRPLYFLIFSALLNTVLDVVFVVFFGLGVSGVALATIISQGISALLIFAALTKEKGAYGLRWRDLHIVKSDLWGILGVGMPTGVQQAITGFSNVFVQSYINAFGSACMAGWSSFNKLDQFVLIPAMCIAQASTTFVGQNWGARNPRRAREGVKQATLMSLTVTAVLAVPMMIFARTLLRAFSPDPAVIDFGVRFLRIATPFYLALCFNQIYSGALRGVGNAKIPMMIMIFSFVLFRQAYLYVSSTLLGGGFVAVALAYPMGWCVCSALLTVSYRRSVLFHPGMEMQEKNIAGA